MFEFSLTFMFHLQRIDWSHVTFIRYYTVIISLVLNIGMFRFINFKFL